jgi:hypothetical protein
VDGRRMNKRRSVRGFLAVAGVIALHVSVLGQVPGVPKQYFGGQGVSPVYEGWYRDGDFLYLSYGYLNLNKQQVVSVPVGPDNKVEPEGPDSGQPTTFLLGRQWGVFSVRVPKELERRVKAEKGAFTWTLTVNGQTFSIPANLNPQYNINALEDQAIGNKPPTVRFAADGPVAVGPYGMRTERTAVVGQPLKLAVYVSDDGIKKVQERARPGMVLLTWEKFRGTGNVVFSERQPKPAGIAPGKTGVAETTATFSEPGRYTLRLSTIDQSQPDNQCCWTNVYVDVAVSASSLE